MDYVVATLLSIMLPPTLIGISSSSDKREKYYSLTIILGIIIFIQMGWGKTSVVGKVIALFIVLLLILVMVRYRDISKEVFKTIIRTYNNFLKELQDPILSTKDTVKVLMIKDVCALTLGILKVFEPAQITIVILGTYFYLGIVELILQDNTELKSSWTTLLNRTRRGVGMSNEGRVVQEGYGQEYTPSPEETRGIYTPSPQPDDLTENSMSTHSGAQQDYNNIPQPSNVQQLPTVPRMETLSTEPPTMKNVNYSTPPPMPPRGINQPPPIPEMPTNRGGIGPSYDPIGTGNNSKN